MDGFDVSEKRRIHMTS